MSKRSTTVPAVRCAIYTRKSTEEGLEQAFNSLDAQREAAEAYIASQQHEGWVCLPDRYDDGGYSGGNAERPALKRLLADIDAGKVDAVIVYKVDRLSRSLLDFARMMQVFEAKSVAFVSVTQHFNTNQSMGRLTLNILLSFAQFERELVSERTRDKIAATRRKGKWSGGFPILGYDVDRERMRLVVNEKEAERVRAIFDLYLEHSSLITVSRILSRRGWTTKSWTSRKGVPLGGGEFNKNNLHALLTNVLYTGVVKYKQERHPGEHEAIIDSATFEKVQKTLRANGSSGGMHVRNKHGALLKGLLRCAPCNAAMTHCFTVRGAKAYRYYTCCRAQKQGWDTCPSKSVPAEAMEQFVVDRIRAMGSDPELVAAAVEAAGAQEREAAEAIRAEAAALGREVRRLAADLRKTAATAGKSGHAAARLADLNEAIRRGEERLAELAQEVEAAEARVLDPGEAAAALARFDPVWESLTPKERAKLLHLVVQSVSYDGGAGTVSITFHPGGIRSLGVQVPEATA